MSSDNKKSSPVPTKHEDEAPLNQSTGAKRSRSSYKLVTLLIIIIIALVIIAAFAGWLEL